MTVFVQQLANGDSFGLQKDLINLLSNAMSNACVTTNSNTAVGNASITGSFMVGNSTVNATFAVANLNFSNSTVNFSYIPPTAAQITSGSYIFSSSGWILGGLPVVNTSIETSGLAGTIVDYWPLNQYTTAKYLVAVIDNNLNNFYSAELLALTDGTGAFLTEYSQLFSNNSIGAFSASANATSFILTWTPTSTNTSVKWSRTGL